MKLRMSKGVPKSRVNKGWIKKGAVLSMTTRLKMSSAKKGHPPPHGFTKEVKERMSDSAKKRAHRELGSRKWAGTRKEYMALHHAIRKLYGQPSVCENCGLRESGRKMHWANLTGLPVIIKSNWRRLCVGCHTKHDRK